MAGWPAGALVPSSPKVRLGLDHRAAHAHASPHPPSPAWLLRLAKISKQASSQQQHTVFGTVRTRAPPLPGYTAMGELPGLEVPFVSRGLPHRIRLMASSTYGEHASPPAQRPREGLSCVTLGQHPLVPLLGQLRRVGVWG